LTDTLREKNYSRLTITATALDVNSNIADYISVNVCIMGSDRYIKPDSITIRLYQPNDDLTSYIYTGMIDLVEDTHNFYYSVPKFHIDRGDTAIVRWMPRGYSSVGAKEFADTLYITIVKTPAVCSSMEVNISTPDIYTNEERFVDSPVNWKEDQFLSNLRVGKIIQFRTMEDTLSAYANNSGSNRLCVDTFGLKLINNDFNSPRNSSSNSLAKFTGIDEDNFIQIVFTETGDSSGIYKSDILNIQEDFIYSYSSLENYYAKSYKDRLYIAPGDRLSLLTIQSKPVFPQGTPIFDLLGNFYILDQIIPVGFSYYPNPVKSSPGDYNSDYLIFDNIKEESSLKIFSIDGRIVYENNFIPEYSYNGVKNRFYWNLVNKDNKKVSSGIYIFIATDTNGNIQKKKIAVIR
ncbi:T9SS type A sorting domain-containing protein, partial [Candidatus Dependentiae bacterium]|nr:T9SS type A sorting domain-containing protein [Candidatus Dependentiae bacterium]